MKKIQQKTHKLLKVLSLVLVTIAALFFQQSRSESSKTPNMDSEALLKTLSLVRSASADTPHTDSGGSDVDPGCTGCVGGSGCLGCTGGDGTGGSSDGVGDGCFIGGTQVEMVDGTYKSIESIEIGDQTRGGVVTAVMKFSVDPLVLLNYQGVIVAGSHAVNENGNWKRVYDSTLAQPALREDTLVYNLNTSEHRIFINGIEFGDWVEVDGNHPIVSQYYKDTIGALNLPENATVQMYV